MRGCFDVIFKLLAGVGLLAIILVFIVWATDEVEDTDDGEGLTVREESDPAIDAIEDLHINDIRGDVTGDWRKSVTSDNIPMPDYAMVYYNTHMNENDIHYIISFSTYTTTQIIAFDTYLTVRVTEYIDGEQHDATTIGGGTEYLYEFIDIKTGESLTE